MKKHLFLKSLLIAIGLLMTCINTAWADTYTVAGNAAIVNEDGGWDATQTKNDMTNISGTTFYKLVVKNASITSGTTYEFKVCVNHGWTTAYPASNASFKAPSTATCDIVFLYNSSDNSVIGGPVYIKGSWDGWASPTYFTNGETASKSLSASTTYEFKIVHGDTWHGNSYAFEGQTASETMDSGNDNNCHINTAGADSYSFSFNYRTKVLTVTFPSVTHPSDKYVYFKNTSNWSPVYGYLFGNGTGGGAYPGPQLNSFNFDGTNYFYMARGDQTKAIFGQNADDKKTSDLTSLASYMGKYYDKSSSTWKNFTATLTLNHQSATNTPAPNSVTVTYNAATNINSDVITTTPTKTGYTFGGYYTSQAGVGTQIIGTNEKIPSDLSTYTSSGKWIKTGSSVSMTIYAKWTQTLNLNSNGATSAGTTSVTATFNGGIGSIATAPSKTAYTFGGWYPNDDGSGVQVINANKVLQANKSNWTDSNTKWIHAGASTLYAKWTQNITLNANTAYHGSGSNTTATVATWNAAAVSNFAVTSAAAGYHVEGYYTGQTDGTKILTSSGAYAGTNITVSSVPYISSGKWVHAAATTLYAHMEGNSYSVRFNGNGNTGGSMSDEAFTYGAAAKALTSNAFTKTGYHFGGWATSAARANAGNVDYTDGQSVSNLTTANSGIFNLYAVWVADTYTVSFDVNGGTSSTPDSKSVTFGSAYGTLPGGMTHASKTFIGWYDDSRDGEGNHITAETTVSIADDHTLYAHYENVYSVNVTFKCGSATIYPATSVNASSTSLMPTITAPEIFGYTFTGWTESGGSYVTFTNASAASTTIKTSGAATVVANYDVVPTVYFKNNLGWDSVFVTFDCGFNSGKENVPHNNGKPYYKMTQIGSTDIYYCEIPSTYTTSDYSGWAYNIAFDNTNYGKTGSTTHTGTWDAFFGGECIGRGDFDPKTTLYIPYSEDTETRNSAKYYKTGCWMKYNSTESGYQVNMNTWVTGSNADTLTVKLEAANAGGYEFSAKLNLKHPNYTYGFKLYKIYQKNTTDLWYTNCPATISSTTDDLPWHFWSGSSVTSTSDRCGLHTEALGDYIITVSFATGRPEVNVEYPASVGDWRLAYNDRIAWSGSTHDGSWYLYSRVIKAEANAEDIVSFYVSKATGASASIELQKCTAIDAGTGAETWVKQSNVSLSDITATGIYNFKVTQNGSKVASAAYLGSYSGNFYIRTDASDGGWNNYIGSGKNIMTYSEYAEENSGFSHYFMRYVTSGSNIKFCIANDYSECLTEYCVSDTYTNEYIEANGNVRFMWDHRTNAVSRAYISGSTNVSDRFLVLEGDAKLFDANGNALSISGLNANEMKFIDDQNWIYEATVKAQPKAKVKLTAKYNNKIQYFYGDEGTAAEDSVLLLDGSGTDKYKMRIVYDFKTNRLIKAFIPDGTISTDLAINADLMIIREHQGEAQQISFSGSGKLSAVKTVYGAMKFNKYTVNGKEKTGGHAATGESRYKRDLFYISFPFDVKLGDVFGFGTYGKHWIIEYYDGVGRAKNGFWADSEPNWKFVMPAQRHDFTMKAFEGYILALELDEMTESSSVWDNGVDSVYIYFPSADSVKNIQATSRLVTIDQTGYQCTIGPRFAGGDDRRDADSYWHCIGVPSFANYSSALSPTSGGATIDWRTGSLPYLYEWNSGDNTLSVTTSANFPFKATYSYLVQYAGTSIYWSSVNTPSGIVARERTAPKNAEFRIELQKAGEKADQTFVRLTQDENVTTGYDFNYDLSKEFNSKKANIYTMVTTIKEDGPSVTKSAANVQPMTEQTTVIPVGVKIATSGDYTFAIPDGTDGVGITLIDNETGIRTSLSALDYTINLSAGTYDSRFVLEISPIKPVATGVEVLNGENGENGVRKVMIDGLLYIVKDGKMYDARGAVVK